MFWELLEAVVKCMIVFQVLNFDPAKEILKIWCQLMKKNTENTMSINEESDYSVENTCENEVFRSTIERN